MHICIYRRIRFRNFQDLLEFVLALKQQIPLDTTPASFVEQMRSEFPSIPANRDSAYASSVTGSSNGSAIGTPSDSGQSGLFPMSLLAARSVASAGRSTVSSGYSNLHSGSSSNSSSTTSSSRDERLRSLPPQQPMSVPELSTRRNSSSITAVKLDSLTASSTSQSTSGTRGYQSLQTISSSTLGSRGNESRGAHLDLHFCTLQQGFF